MLVLFAAYATRAALPWLVRRHGAGNLGNAAARLGLPMLLTASAFLGALHPHAAALLRAAFGPEFATAAPALRWLLFAALAIYASATLLMAVVAAGRTRTVLAITVSALVLNVLGNAWLVPERGIEGAAIATLATEILVLGGSAWALAARRTGPLAGRSLGWLAAPAVYAAAAWGSSFLPIA
jgi:O-antigen/teichoic acid export membrane protein